MIRKPLSRCLVALLAALSTPLLAQAQAPMELRGAMQDMNRNLQAAADGLSRQDWARVANAAALIADHPQPSAEEKRRIIAFFGPDMGRFKGFDTETGEAAQQLVRAAQDKNGKQAIDTAVALRCAGLQVPEPRSERDALIAATAIAHSMTVVTRNTADFEKVGVPLINPWLPAANPPS